MHRRQHVRQQVHLVSGLVALALLAGPAHCAAASPAGEPAPSAHPSSDARAAAAAAPSRAIVDAAREAARAPQSSGEAPASSDSATVPRSPSAAMARLPRSCGALETVGLYTAVVVACYRLNSCPGGVRPASDVPVCKIDRWI